MTVIRITTFLLVLVLGITNSIAGATETEDVSIEQVSKSIEQKLEKSLEQLSSLRQKAAEEKIPLSEKLNQLEKELIDVKGEYQKTSRLLDSRTLDLNNLRNEIKSRKEESVYLSNLLNEYTRNFESRLHIGEIQLYRDSLEQAKLTADNVDVSSKDIYKSLLDLLFLSLERVEASVGGRFFEGKVADQNGLIKTGEIAMIGPIAVFKSDNGEIIGTVEQRLGSLEPTISGFSNPEDTEATRLFMNREGKYLPIDTTLGNAHIMESTNETLWEHIQKGGPVMVPILLMATFATLVSIYKWLSMIVVRKPNRKSVRTILDLISLRNYEKASEKAISIGGPFGKMIKSAIEHIKEPPELIEEVMYETVLETKLKLQKMLPFVAICAASAPLLGLLGTVTGIINTFKLITVFGSGDVKTLSGGISEALITTEFGLIVAIPSLLLHAFLSRKAQGVVDEMEKIAVSVVNQVSKKQANTGNIDGVVADA